MNKEIVIKNKVDSMNIVFPNAKVGEEYCQLIKIDDADITEYWLEGLEKTELTAALEEVGGDTVEETIDAAKDEVSHESSNGDIANNCDAKDTFNTEEKVVNEISYAVLGNSMQGIVVSGNISKAGYFDVVLKYKYKGWVEGDSILERKFKVFVNPDPKSLWKDIPTDKNVKFYKPDYSSEFVIVDGKDSETQKDLIAASKRGRSHAHEGKARDDHFQLYHNNDNNWYVVAVADGAGSAKFSRKGSQVACAVAIEHCKQALNDSQELEDAVIELNNAEKGASNRTLSTIIYNIVGGAAHKAHRAVVETAELNDDQPRDYATTFLLAICKKFEFGWFVASFWVGDGAMCIYDKENQYIRLLGTPDGGEYAGQTRFLTMKEIFTPKSIMSRLKYSIEQDFTALLLMTDGVSDPFFETDANLNKVEKWNELWDVINKDVDLSDNNSSAQYELLKWLDFWSPGNHDDRTIAILY